MKEFNIYQRHNNNLISIKFTEEHLYERDIHIRNQLKIYFEFSNFILVKVRRPVCLDIQHILVQLEEYDKVEKINDLKYDNQLFEISFNLSKYNLNDRLVGLLVTIWLEYEQPLFSCFLDKKEFINSKMEIIRKNLSWREITAFSTCFVMFKSIEENVIWLGKSEKLNFIE